MDTFLPRVKEYERGEFWTYSHESNFVRLLVILQRGGIYIDSDLIVTKPFAGDFQNSVGHEMPLGMDGGQKVCLFSFSSKCFIEEYTKSSTQNGIFYVGSEMKFCLKICLNTGEQQRADLRAWSPLPD